jgi:hypothetical protein
VRFALPVCCAAERDCRTANRACSPVKISRRFGRTCIYEYMCVYLFLPDYKSTFRRNLYIYTCIYFHRTTNQRFGGTCIYIYMYLFSPDYKSTFRRNLYIYIYIYNMYLISPDYKSTFRRNLCVTTIG